MTRAHRGAENRGVLETVHACRRAGGALDLTAEFGPGWYVGTFDRPEGQWLAETSDSAHL
jgi:hypothetical protein